MPEAPPESRWRLSRTISLDSVIVLVVSIISGLVFLLTMNAKIEQQAQSMAGLKDLVERMDADHKERVTRLERDSAERAARMERDSAERSARLEAAIKEQAALMQAQMLPNLRR